MLVKDSEKVQQHVVQNAIEAHKQERLDWLKNQLEDSVYVGNLDSDPTNFASRLGRPMNDYELEQKLKKLEPNLIFEDVEPASGGRPRHKRMLIRQGAGAKHLLIYEKGTMPERSWMQPVIQEHPNPDLFNPNKPMRLDRKDLTKHEIIPAEFDAAGNLTREPDVIFDDTVPLLGIQRTVRPWAERIRGWRTILGILVSAGVISPTQAESFFGIDHTPEWAAKMGRRVNTRPW